MSEASRQGYTCHGAALAPSRWRVHRPPCQLETAVRHVASPVRLVLIISVAQWKLMWIGMVAAVTATIAVASAPYRGAKPKVATRCLSRSLSDARRLSRREAQATRGAYRGVSRGVMPGSRGVMPSSRGVMPTSRGV